MASKEVPGFSFKRSLKGHNEPITRIAWSPDGRQLASGSIDKTIRIWDAETGKCAQVIAGHDEWVWCVAWSPDGQRLASASQDWTVRIWDAKSGAPLQTLRGPDGPVYSVSWSRDGKMLASASFDALVRVWDTAEWKLLHSLPCLFGGGVNSVCWSPTSYWLASGSFDGNIRLWDGAEGKFLYELRGHGGSVSTVDWSPDGKLLASGSADRSIRIWDPRGRRQTWYLEGHTDGIARLAFSGDGRFLASRSQDGTVRCWHVASWKEVAKIDEPGSGNPRIEWHAGLAFRPHSPELATLDQGDKYIRLWHLDLSILQDIASATPAVHYTRAKIVLVGESNIGKSCLALRLKEDRYEGEMATTHGLQFWILPANELSPSILPPPGERREVILWDMGGQEVYSLVHQIFLSDTALALVAFDPTRGTAAFQEAEAWSKRLDQHFKGANVTKLLVGTRLDDESVVIDYARTEQLIKEGGFAGFYPTSAKTCRGIPELREAMAESLNWQNLLRNSRPDLFRRIRDKIQDLTDQGTVVVLYDTLMEQVRRESQSQEDFEEAAVDTVVKQLSMQGVIVHTRLASGERALVLDIGEVERYGCSVVIVARDNLRGVPAVEERMLAKRWMKFPRIEEDQRLPRGKECAVLEAVIQLLLEHGICLRHERMLVFPSLFQPWSGGEQTAVLSSALLFYELVGGIDNIYASLVSRLAVSGRFGLMRLWVDEAEFERAGRGACGLRRVARGSGYAHLDVRFEEKVPDKTRELFVQFVKKHLRQSGVRIVEHLDVTCACGYRFPELVILERLHQNLADVGCPNCDRRTLLSDAARSGVAKDSNLKDAIRVLEEKVTRVTQLNIDRAKDYFKDRDRRSPRQPIRILHLSDLHMNDKSDPRGMLPLLIADLTNTDGGLGIDVLNYLVVSGDLTCQAAPLEFDKAREFVSGLIERFRKALTYERCIIVPGNHDVDWSVQAYSWRGRRPGDTAHLEPGTYVESEKVLLVRDDEAYRLRFQSFSDNFYHPLVQQPYPLPYRDQCIPFFFPFTRIQFLAINSCWETDEFHPDRASIDFSSLASGLQKAEEQIEQARRRRSGGDLPVLRIAVWHHPIYDSGGLELEPFLSYLQTAHVRLGLHGHVHEDRANLARHLSRQPIHIVGAGSLGASSGQLPPATPNLYNLIEIWSDAKTKNHTKIRVRTRCQKYPKGPWGPYPGWPSKTPGEYRDFYEIDLH